MGTVTAVAADSMGVRSFCLFYSGSRNVIIDPGAALGPRRYGLSPAVEEYARLDECLDSIRATAEKADAVVVSHYHRDHYLTDVSLYSGRDVFLKDWDSGINRSQANRSRELLEAITPHAKSIHRADATSHTLDDMRITFSPPFPHGQAGTRLGYVIMTLIEDEEVVLHTSDVCGLVDDSALDFVLGSEADITFLDGLPTILLGYRIPHGLLEKSVENIMKVLDETDTKLVIDHHLLRDTRYRELMGPVYEYSEEIGRPILSMAGFMGIEENLLEARRKELWNRRDQVSPQEQS